MQINVCMLRDEVGGMGCQCLIEIDLCLWYENIPYLATNDDSILVNINILMV